MHLMCAQGYVTYFGIRVTENVYGEHSYCKGGCVWGRIPLGSGCWLVLSTVFKTVGFIVDYGTVGSIPAHFRQMFWRPRE